MPFLSFDCKFTLIFPFWIKTVCNNDLLCPYRIKYMISGLIAWHKQSVYTSLERTVALVTSFTQLPVVSSDSFDPLLDFPTHFERLVVVILIQLIFGKSCCRDVTSIASNVTRRHSASNIYEYMFMKLYMYSTTITRLQRYKL